MPEEPEVNHKAPESGILLHQTEGTPEAGHGWRLEVVMVGE